MSLRSLLSCAACALFLAAISCTDQEPEVKLGKLVREPPTAGSTASTDELNMILVHERAEIEFLQCMRKEPVCGQDGKTYPNACQAKKAGVEVDSDVDGGC